MNMDMRNAELKDAVKAAFKDLRQLGFAARMNFLCCQSCGHYSLSDLATKTAQPAGEPDYVFYHAQSAAAFAEPITPLNPLFLHWSGRGEPIRSALVANGLIVNWDGDRSKAMEVTGLDPAVTAARVRIGAAVAR